MFKPLFSLPLIFCLLIISACSGSESAKEFPNIIYILADDAGYGDFGVYGQTKFATPNIDRLAAEGIRFTQHYAGSTVCAPSRSVLMTGLHTGHTFIRGNQEVRPEGQWPLPDSVYTLAEMLQDAGYVTGAFGKWGLGFPGSEGDPMNQGLDRFFGYNCQRIAHTYYPDTLWDNDRQIPLPGNYEGGTGTYSHDLIMEEALIFIEQHRDMPFFLFIPSTIPHAELIAPEDSILVSFQEQFDEPAPYQGVDFGAPNFRNGPYVSQPTPRAAFAAMMTRLDMAVGDVLDKLSELDLDKKTIVFFTTDNGPGKEGGMDPDFFDSNGPLRGYKRDVYEGGIRVPLLVRWPGQVAAGTVTGHVSAFWDVLPTLAEIAGVTYPGSIDGISFLPELLGKDGQPEHDHLYWEFHERGGRQAVRKGNWKAVKLNAATDPEARIELFDLANDLGETNNVADAHPDVVEEMARLLEEAHEPSEVFPGLDENLP
jgi:arylsulfatase A-like enzyme